MSNLSSIFDIIRGWPYASALSYGFKQKALVSPDIEEGTVVQIEDESGIPVVDRWTSALVASNNEDNPWIVMRGRDEEDAVFTEKLTCIKLRTGTMFRVATTETPLPGDLVYANWLVSRLNRKLVRRGRHPRTQARTTQGEAGTSRQAASRGTA